MFFIHVICRKDGRIDPTKKIEFGGQPFQIDPNMTLTLKNESKNLFIFPMSHHRPIRIVERLIRIDVLKFKASGKCFFSSIHTCIPFPDSINLNSKPNKSD